MLYQNELVDNKISNWTISKFSSDVFCAITRAIPDFLLVVSFSPL